MARIANLEKKNTTKPLELQQESEGIDKHLQQEAQQALYQSTDNDDIHLNSSDDDDDPPTLPPPINMNQQGHSASSNLTPQSYKYTCINPQYPYQSPFSYRYSPEQPDIARSSLHPIQLSNYFTSHPVTPQLSHGTGNTAISKAPGPQSTVPPLPP
uniref:Uncharacterized protein n=1 Tax=Amphimedon queenslandica TaxID=400682 RepID=A0A1X7V5T8_AMPQE